MVMPGVSPTFGEKCPHRFLFETCMFVRAMIAVLFAAGVAAVILTLRHQRYETMHEMAMIHRQIDISRQNLWDRQTRIAAELKPELMRQTIEDARLKLIPVAPTIQPIEPTRTAELNDVHRRQAVARAD